MQQPSLALTPEALTMMDAIARSGSFAAAARELGKVPSALTYSVRQLEDALDVLLFDRRSRQAKLTAAGQELLDEGRRLLAEIDAVANRVRRVASGWESQFTIVMDDVIERSTVLELCEAFFALHPQGGGSGAGGSSGGPGTRLSLRTEVMAGTWEALLRGQADLAIGIGRESPPPSGVAVEPLGELAFIYAVAPHHPLAAQGPPLTEADLLRHRAVAVADSAQRLAPLTVNLLPGQEVLTVATMADKVSAIQRGLGSGYLPEPIARASLRAGSLLAKKTQGPARQVKLGYAWRCVVGAKGRKPVAGLALQWWLEQLARPTTRRALLDRHADRDVA